MRTTPKQYAISLFEASKGATKEEMDGLIINFIRLLRQNNDFSLANKIIEEYAKHYRAEKGIARLKVTSSEKLGSDEVSDIVKHFQRQVELEEAVDPSLVGGIILEIDDDIRIDGSVRHKLAILKESIN